MSFDDNYQSWYEALTLLNESEIHVTFYINTLPLSEGRG